MRHPAGVFRQERRGMVTVLPPRVVAPVPVGPELTAMRAACASEGVTDFPPSELELK